MMPRVDVCPLADTSLPAALREHHFRLQAFVNVLTRPIPSERGLCPAA